MIKVYDAENLLDAQLLSDWLRDDGIESHIHGSYLSGAIGELPISSLISLWIDGSRCTLRARELITEFERNRRAPTNSIQCPRCHEQIEGNFSICWQCGAILPPEY